MPDLTPKLRAVLSLLPPGGLSARAGACSVLLAELCNGLVADALEFSLDFAENPRQLISRRMRWLVLAARQVHHIVVTAGACNRWRLLCA